MHPLAHLIWRGVVWLCLLDVALVVAAFWGARALPDHETADRIGGCYWTDAMLPVVRCGSGAVGAGPRAAFYNLPIFHVFNPVLSGLVLLILIAAVLRCWVRG